MTDTHDSPQNPYTSFVVAASAGSGKTYQLSRRFLFLVGAGAAPGAILTVTFTKKAAGEMRQRILEAAAKLAASPREQAQFDAELAAFRAAAGPFGPPPAVPAVHVARQVLASSQLLKISTIDSLYLEWVSKFPAEAGGNRGDSEGAGGAEPGLPTPFTLLNPSGGRSLDALAWRATCKILSRGLRSNDEAAAQLFDACPDGAVHDLAERLAGLDRLETYLWYAEQSHGGEAFLAHPPPALTAAPFAAAAATGIAVGTLSEPELLGLLAADMRAIAGQLADLGRRDRCLEALGSGRLADLLATELVTKKDLGISGRFLRGAKRDAVAAQVGRVEALLRAFHDQQCLARLNRAGHAQYRIYLLYRRLRDQLKLDAGAVEFRDLVKGCYRLFHGDAGAGVRFLLARTIQHLLLDEFQDTSRLQWSVFGEMASQLLAGDGASAPNGPPPTVFIVGDAKQSIYGFREADPAVMGDAAVALADRLRLAPLNASYRTAQVVLDFVNVVFATPGGTFPLHATASLDGVPFVPDVGRVMVAPQLEAAAPAGGDTTDATELAVQEAELVAGLLGRALSGALPCPVYDKETQRFRQLLPADCCLLYRSTTKAAVFEAALRRAGIPCQREEERGFFGRPEVLDAMALLRFLALPGDMVALATLLRSPLAAVPDRSVLALLAATKGARERTDASLKWLAEEDHPLSLTLARLLGLAPSALPHELLLEAYGRLDAFTAYAGPAGDATSPPGQAALAQRNLLRLAELCMRLEDEGLAQLPALVERLEAMAGDDELGNAASARAAVTLMTIHKAKGLEFPLVALVDSGRPWGRRDVHWTQGVGDGGRPGIYYIGRRDSQPLLDPTFRRLADDAEAATTAECQRLLYVALTRARQYLLVTGHKPGRSGQGLSSTTVYDQLAAAAAVPPLGRVVSDGNDAVLGVAAPGKVWSYVPDELAEVVRGEQAPATAAAAWVPAAILPWTLTSDPLMPRELVVKSPSVRHAAYTHTSRLRPSAVLGQPLAAAIGTFVHKGLEAYMQGQSFAAGAAWRTSSAGLMPTDVPALALAELAAVLADPTLARLKASSLRVETEMALVHRRSGELMIGTLDLLVEDARGRLTIIDYKTTQFDGDPAALGHVADDELKRYCEDRGYDAQLADYARAVAALYPGAPVATAVYFTSLRRLVILSGMRDVAGARRRRAEGASAWQQGSLFDD